MRACAAVALAGVRVRRSDGRSTRPVAGRVDESANLLPGERQRGWPRPGAHPGGCRAIAWPAMGCDVAPVAIKAESHQEAWLSLDRGAASFAKDTRTDPRDDLFSDRSEWGLRIGARRSWCSLRDSSRAP